jgi:hypothetical protein
MTRQTPIIDLASIGPGMALITGARAPYFPWLIKGYPSMTRITNLAWDSLSEQEKRGLGLSFRRILWWQEAMPLYTLPRAAIVIGWLKN